MNVDYPYHFDSLGRTSDTDRNDHIRDMIEQVLFTNPGERVNRPGFGCGLAQLVFEPNRTELAATTQYLVQSALQQWLGDLVEVQEIDVTAIEARLTVKLAYRIRSTGEQRSDSFDTGGVAL